MLLIFERYWLKYHLKITFCITTASIPKPFWLSEWSYETNKALYRIFLAFSGCVHPTHDLSSMGHNGLKQKKFWRFSQEKKVLLKQFWKLWYPFEMCKRFTTLFLYISIFIERKLLFLISKINISGKKTTFILPTKTMVSRTEKILIFRLKSSISRRKVSRGAGLLVLRTFENFFGEKIHF